MIMQPKILPIFIISILALALLALTSCSSQENNTCIRKSNTNTTTTGIPTLGSQHASIADYELVKQYEFNGTSINAEDWYFDTEGNSGSWGNSEAQHYTGANDGNAYIKDNALVIEAKAESKGGKSFTSARLHTHGLFTMRYGIIEARIKLPQNNSGITDVASWPALWMLGKNFNGWGHTIFGGNTAWPQSGEIDIMESNLEQYGYSKVLSTLHWQNGVGGHSHVGDNTNITNPTSEYHTYSMRWTSSQIFFYLDNTLFHAQDISSADKEEFRKEFFLLVNLAVGSADTGFTGKQVADANKYPQYMYVDWIRIYQDPCDSDSTRSTS